MSDSNIVARGVRLAYITSHTPWGSTETFVLDEIVEHIQCGWNVWIFPVHPGATGIFHAKAAVVLPTAKSLGWFDREVRRAVWKRILKQPGRVFHTLRKVVWESRANPRALASNLLVFPKAVCIADHIEQLGIEHIHAHWLSTPTTCAYIAAQLSGVTYSFTSHAWDIFNAKNMIAEKINRSAFAITSTSYNLRHLQSHYPEADPVKLRVLNTGIRLDHRQRVEKVNREDDAVRLICVANLVEKKGHRYLLQALAQLKSQGHRCECLLVGDGVLREEIAEEVARLGLADMVKLVGKMPHEEVLKLLSSGTIDIFVLPSIILPNGEREGLPFSLMEAMAYGIPVISTNTAGTAELVMDGAGLLVEQRSVDQLAQAIEQLIRNPTLRETMGSAGQTEVEQRFNLHHNAAILREMIVTTVQSTSS